MLDQCVEMVLEEGMDFVVPLSGQVLGKGDLGINM